MADDTLYRRQMNSVVPFVFDDEVAHVFDNMAERSIPGYAEVLRLSAELIRWVCDDGDAVADVGASTGALLEAIRQTVIEKGLNLRVIDISEPMLKAAGERAQKLGLKDRVNCERADVRECTWRMEAVVVLNFVLQFIPPVDRLHVLQAVREGLRPGGVLVYSEKIIAEDEGDQRLLDEFYYAFKFRNGYSETEIAQKREALKGVLIPLSARENEQLLLDAGFQRVQRLVSWGPFVTWAAFR